MAFGQNNTGFQVGIQTPFSTGFSTSNWNTNSTQTSPKNNTLVTYNSRYPGFDEEDYKRLEQIADAQGVTGSKKAQLMDELYQYYFPQVLNKHKLDERQEVINNSVYENGNALLNGDSNTTMNTKLVQLSQKAKESLGIAYDVDDNEVIGAMTKNIPNGDKLLADYINTGNPEIYYAAGIYERPEEKKETFGQKVADFGVGALQSPGKRGYNMIGQWMDRVGKRAGEGAASMLSAEQKEKLVDRLDKNTIFKRNEIEEYAKELARQEAEGTTFNGREQTDIRTPILGEERANSTATKVGEIIGDIATGIAMSYPLSAALAPAMAGGTTLDAALLGAIEGGIDTLGTQYGTQGNLDITPLQAILGIGGGALGGVVTNKLANVGAASDKIDDLVDKTDDVSKSAKEAQISSKIADKTDDANKVAGRIGQGDLDDQSKVVEGVRSITKRNGKNGIEDIKSIKTYDQLDDAIRNTEKQIVKEEDELLKQFPDKIKDWTTTETVKGIGDQTDDITRDYLDEGIELLKKYNKNDPAALRELEMLQEVKNTEGLTRLEAKGLARKLTTKLSKKFYNSNDELRNSMSAESYEAIRKGIQNAVRDRLPDNALKNLDLEYSNLKAFEGLTDDMAEKVNTLTQKLKEVGPIEKLGRKVGDAINFVTGKGIKGLVEKFLPSNMGNKINNSIDIEMELSKNLGKLVDLNQAIDVLNTSLTNASSQTAINSAFKSFANAIADLQVPAIVTTTNVVSNNTLDK